MTTSRATVKSRRRARPIRIGDDAAGKRHYLPRKVRKYHLQILGAPGRGKSKYMEYLLRRDILDRQGLCLIDPHGSLYGNVLRWCVEKGISDRRLILIEPGQQEWTCGFNPLDFSGFSNADIADGVEAMVKACAGVWGGEDLTKTPRLARILPAVFHALAVTKMTLGEALHLCDAHDTDGVRAFLTRKIRDPVFRQEWEQFNQLDARQYTELFESTRNRLAAFLRNPLVRSMVSQKQHAIDLGEAMDEGVIVLVSLAGLPQEVTRLLGALFIHALFLKALRRDPERPRPFYLYVDECYYFFNEDIARILTEGRKFGLHAILAHQNLGQLRNAGDAVYTSVMQIENKMIFGGVRPPADAGEIAETIFAGAVNLEEPKNILDKPVVTGYVREWLRSRSGTVTETAGRSTSRGTTATTTVSGRDEETTKAVASGENVSSTDVESLAVSRGTGASETFRPELTWLPTAVYSWDEQIKRAMATMVEQPTRHAVVKIHGTSPLHIQTPFVSDPKANQGRRARFTEQVFRETQCVQSASEARALLDRREQELRRRAKAGLHNQEPEDFFE